MEWRLTGASTEMLLRKGDRNYRSNHKGQVQFPSCCSAFRFLKWESKPTTTATEIMAAAMTGTNGKASRTATVKLTQSRSEKANEKVKAWFMEQNKVVVAGERRGMG